MSVSSCLDITQAVTPPRAVFLNYPLGHPIGKPFDRELQRTIIQAALEVLVTADQPGTLVQLPYKWNEQDPGDRWEDGARIH